MRVLSFHPIFASSMIEQAPKFRVRKKKLGSYPFVSTVLSITLALLVMGVFGTLVIYSRELERVVRENVNINQSQRLQIEKDISSRYFLPKDRKESAIQFVSKDDAAKQFIDRTGEDFREFLGENPLRDAFLVWIDPLYQDQKSIEKIKSEVEQISGVFQVDYVPNMVASINRNVARIGVVLISLSALLLVVVVVLIHNTLRLALFSQRFLIRSMQLVGATRWFIQGPFLTRAAIHGLLAGFLSCAILVGLVSLANDRLDDLKMIENPNRLIILLGSLILMGIFVAVLSTYSAVSKYLRLSLDELY